MVPQLSVIRGMKFHAMQINGSTPFNKLSNTTFKKKKVLQLFILLLIFILIAGKDHHPWEYYDQIGVAPTPCGWGLPDGTKTEAGASRVGEKTEKTPLGPQGQQRLQGARGKRGEKRTRGRGRWGGVSDGHGKSPFPLRTSCNSPWTTQDAR